MVARPCKRSPSGKGSQTRLGHFKYNAVETKLNNVQSTHNLCSPTHNELLHGHVSIPPCPQQGGRNLTQNEVVLIRKLKLIALL